MDLALFHEYIVMHMPQLRDVVQPNGMYRRLQHVHKLGKGMLRERFRTYKKMWPDGGKVFAFFTVPTPTAIWSTERDIPSLREQQLINPKSGLLRARCYHGEWVDADLRSIVRAMQDVHKPSEGQFYICNENAIHAIDVHREVDSGEAAHVPRKVMPLRQATEHAVVLPESRSTAEG